jgi:hypothetical protein
MQCVAIAQAQAHAHAHALVGMTATVPPPYTRDQRRRLRLRLRPGHTQRLPANASALRPAILPRIASLPSYNHLIPLLLSSPSVWKWWTCQHVMFGSCLTAPTMIAPQAALPNVRQQVLILMRLMLVSLEIVSRFRSTPNAIVHGGKNMKQVKQMVPAFDIHHGRRSCSALFRQERAHWRPSRAFLPSVLPSFLPSFFPSCPSCHYVYPRVFCFLSASPPATQYHSTCATYISTTAFCLTSIPTTFPTGPYSNLSLSYLVSLPKRTCLVRVRRPHPDIAPSQIPQQSQLQTLHGLPTAFPKASWFCQA